MRFILLSGGLRKGIYRIVIKRHAFVRAIRRKIAPDLVEQTLQHGRMKRFGRNCVRFEKHFRNFTVICVDEIIGNMIKILTIEKRRR